MYIYNIYIYKIFNFDDVTGENTITQIVNWTYIYFRPSIWNIYRILLTDGSGSRETNALPSIGRIYLYAKKPLEAKYQLFINKHENVGLKHYNNPKSFVECLNDMKDVYENIDECNPRKSVKY